MTTMTTIISYDNYDTTIISINIMNWMVNALPIMPSLSYSFYSLQVILKILIIPKIMQFPISLSLTIHLLHLFIFSYFSASTFPIVHTSWANYHSFHGLVAGLKQMI